MLVDGTPLRTIWPALDRSHVNIIDQRWLPHRFEVASLRSWQEVEVAIAEMWVRGAPLIGAAAAYGMALAMAEDTSDNQLARAAAQLAEARPTAVNLRWAIERMTRLLREVPSRNRTDAAFAAADAIADEDVACCSAIGDHGLVKIRELAAKKPGRLGILTHCNAGWLATVDWGTALAPIYKAHDAGIELMVYVDETRPRNQGASLTAWELGKHGVPHTVIVDNAGGHLMQHGLVDMCIVGSDRTTRTGDVCNKVGTYLKALAARESGVPFYVALPASTIDWSLRDGVAEIPIEERDAREVTHIRGRDDHGEIREVALCPEGSAALNIAFDVTPAALVTALLTERGSCAASESGLLGLYPERA